MNSATSRLRLVGFWNALTFLLETTLFLLIGLQLERILEGLGGGAGTPLLDAAAVLGGLFAIRLAWMFAAAPLLRDRDGGMRAAETRAELIVFGWSGMRGGLSLAAALALPLTARGAAFPDRSLLIFISYIAIAASLVVPGLTLPVLVRRLGLGEGRAAARAEARARISLAHAALEHIEEVAARDRLAEPMVEQLRSAYQRRIDRLHPEETAADGGRPAADAHRVLDLRRELIGVERARLDELRRAGEISVRAERRIEHDLDLEESRLAAR